MFAPKTLEAWEIEELERMRRYREEESRQIAELPLELPLGAEIEPPRPSAPPARTVVVIQVW